MTDNTLAKGAGHERGCHETPRPSQLLEGWGYCPACSRMIEYTLASAPSPASRRESGLTS